MMINKFFFRSGDLVKYSKVEYFAKDSGEIESSSDDKIAMFMNFAEKDEEHMSEIYIFSESDIASVPTHDLILLSRNEK